jgi:signal transduction histidine kinase
MKSLRSRLIISHLLPLLIIIPLMGVALIYLVETRVILPGMLHTLEGNSALVAEITRDDFQLWTDPIYAQTILARVSPRLPARVMLFNGDGQLVASSDPTDLKNLTKILQDNPGLDGALQGNIVNRVYYNQQLQGEAIEVWEPVLNRQNLVIGVVRMTYPFDAISADFIQSRSLIALILLIGMAFGGLLGFSLALTIETPLRKATNAVFNLARGQRSNPLEESGPLELRRLASAVNSLVDRLHSLEESRKRLLANLVHELGRPLGALRSAVQALQNGANQDPQLETELLNGMHDELIRLQALLGELTQHYDQVLGTMELERQDIDINPWILSVVAPWQAVAREKGQEILTQLPANPAPLHADPNRLGQAVGNLLSNAVKFTPSGGKITIRAGQESSEFWLRVIDQGPGIPMDELEKVFIPFFRGSQGKRFTEGMGLGLSIARDLVTAHGGRLELSSAPGQGSTFTIHIPFLLPS